MSSPLPAYEASAARLRLMSCLEASQAITPEVFAYREGLPTSAPILVAPAAAETSLGLYASVAIGDHNESDAFFRIVQEDTAALIPEETGEWNFGAWAVEFYSRHAMCPSTSSGLPPPLLLWGGALPGPCLRCGRLSGGGRSDQRHPNP